MFRLGQHYTQGNIRKLVEGYPGKCEKHNAVIVMAK